MSCSWCSYQTNRIQQNPKVSTFIPPNWKELGAKAPQDQMSLCSVGELFFHIDLQVVTDFVISEWEPYTQEYLMTFSYYCFILMYIKYKISKQYASLKISLIKMK